MLDAPAVSLDDIKYFRQLGSRTPGHPEYRLTTGVETTTGPLGQGVGERAWAWPSPRGGWPPATTGRASTLFDFDVYAICGDGCMMEGVSSEAASLAGHLKLANLCWLYDNNHISIDGNTDAGLHRGRRRSGSRPTAGASPHVTDANDLDAAREGARRSSSSTRTGPR